MYICAGGVDVKGEGDKTYNELRETLKLYIVTLKKLIYSYFLAQI